MPPVDVDLPAFDQVAVRYKGGKTAAEARSHGNGLGATVKKQIVGPAVPHGRLAMVRVGDDGVTMLEIRAGNIARETLHESPQTLWLSVTDSRPCVWIGRLLSLPDKEEVCGRCSRG
jgi:hypothetical protein